MEACQALVAGSQLLLLQQQLLLPADERLPDVLLLLRPQGWGVVHQALGTWA